jgi:hypothetical protein
LVGRIAEVALRVKNAAFIFEKADLGGWGVSAGEVGTGVFVLAVEIV